MSSDPEPLAAKVSARLCHDIVSPLGAISNGLELLELSGIVDTPEIELIRASVDQANARLRFLRLAFGPGDGDAKVARDDLLAQVQGRYGDNGTSVAWESGEELSRAEAKAVFLALLALEGVTARGGQIMVQGREGTWQLVARSPSPIIDPGLWSIVENREKPADPPPAKVHFLALRQHMKPDGRMMEVSRSDEGMRVTLRL